MWQIPFGREGFAKLCGVETWQQICGKGNESMMKDNVEITTMVK